jgi:chromosome segregation ATPase
MTTVSWKWLMPAVEERVSYLEARMEDLSKSITLLHAEIASVNKKLDAILIAVIGGMSAIVATLIAKLT